MEGAMQRREDLTVRDLGSRMILFDETSGTFHVLNGSARSIWLLLAEEGSPAALRTRYESLYPKEDPARLAHDLSSALADFGRRGLISDGAPAPP